jgi:hypothetical protein
MWRLPARGRPPKTIMMMFSSGNGATSLPSGPSSGSVPQVRDNEVMKLHIMPQSLSLCLTGYAWFGQASPRSLLKWSVGILAERLPLRVVAEVPPMPELPASQPRSSSRLAVVAVPRGRCLHHLLPILMPFWARRAASSNGASSSLLGVASLLTYVGWCVTAS